MNTLSQHTRQRVPFIRLVLFGSLMLISGMAAAQSSHVTVGGNVFGGGKMAPVGRGTTVLINQSGAVVTGDVYGGGALAKVDTALVAVAPQTPVTATSIDSTLVTVLQGTVKGNVYGGGLGQAAVEDDPATLDVDETVVAVEADVYGGVHVYIGNSEGGSAILGNTVGLNVTGGNVFGCNNVNGSPKKDVKVDIWQTAHTDPNEVDHDNVFTTFTAFKNNVSHEKTAFAIQGVYGGGNEANYVPLATNTYSSSVFIHNCDNTVKMVYGGGRAADVGMEVAEDNLIKANVYVTVEGGRIDTLFGGGDGHTLTDPSAPWNASTNPYRAADIYGNAISAINGGFFTAAFAGSNTAGDIIGGSKQLTVLKTGPCSDGVGVDQAYEFIISLFGGSNEATTHGDVELTVGCGVDNIEELYGGSNKAEIIDGDVTLNVYGGNTANVYGGSKGVKQVGNNPSDPGYVAPVAANIDGDVTLNLYGGTMTNAFGGSNQNGNITGVITVNVLDHKRSCPLNVTNIYGGGNVTPYTPDDVTTGVKPISPIVNVMHIAQSGGVLGSVYGGGLGADAIVNANPQVTIGYDATYMSDYIPESHAVSADTLKAIVTVNVYGGGDAAAVNGNTAVIMRKGHISATTQVAEVFGGGNAAGVSGAASVTVYDGTIMAGLYGGCNTSGTVGGDITVTLNGGTVGVDDANYKDGVYGGGYGHSTSTSGDVTVTVDGASAVVYGDVYGGSGFGSVNDAASDSTTVNIIDGEVKGDVFGGGLGQVGDDSDPGNIIPAYAAPVNGVVTVNIGQDDGDGTYSGNAVIGGNVYGCNNTNGSPQQDVTVNIYATAQTTTPNDNTYSGTYYALNDVFGGGKNADFNITDKRATVNVYSCDNTIRRVFGGGDAAAVTGSAVMIQGGRINNVFGGGNGEITAANVGVGGINLDMHGGKIGTLVSASNTLGSIGGPITVTVDNASGCDEEVTDFFGGSNMVDIETDVTTTIECGAGTFTNVYGGSNQAHITGNVVLNIKGGTMQNVYGGSKGVKQVGSEGDPGYVAPVPANITGDVTLNLYGGTISQDAFGGSNQNGAITGNITVNVLDHETEDCGLNVNNIYGAGNVTTYAPADPDATSPTINVMHVKRADGIRGNVYGGGKGETATVTAQPRVNIGYDATTMASLPNVEYPEDIDRATEYVAKVAGSVFGGGNEALTEGSPIVKMEHPNSRVGNLFGGGDNVGISGSTTININNGTVTNSVYGGCNTTGTVTGSSNITLLGGTVGSVSSNGNIFGGGFGHSTYVDGDVQITYGNQAGTATPTLYGNLYGGSALGAVNTYAGHLDDYDMNTEETTTIDILSGAINGNVFGGGLGQADDPEVAGDQSIAAIVHGEIQINVGYESGGTYYGDAVLRDATIYGCNNINGTPQHDVYIDIYKTHRDASDEVGVTTGATYAIAHVYGGGYQANYAPTFIYRRPVADINAYLVAHEIDVNDSTQRPFVKKPHVYVHGCDNTISELYGGGNAASVTGDSVVFDGGRYDLVFGGGNGAIKAADVGIGGVFLEGKGGFCGFIYEHCNRRGAITGKVTFVAGSDDEDDCNDGVLKVHNHYCGGNEVNILGNFVYTFNCSAEEGKNIDYNALYGGCRLGTTYGNITLNIYGGRVGTIFGGPRGADGFAANVKKFPATLEEMVQDTVDHIGDERKYTKAMIDWMKTEYAAGRDWYGKGGNVTINLYGGTIGDVFGGCDVNGNVEGNITIIVDSTGTTCPLDIDNIYGGGNLATYNPIDATSNYPLIDLRNGHVNHNVYGGGKGSLASVSNGIVTSNPKVHMHPTGKDDNDHDKHFLVKGNIYGGGELGQVQGSTTVLIENGIVKGSVYGAGLGSAADEDFGLVAKNTTVDMRNGLVEHNIYGGGEMSSVGTFTRTNHAVTACAANTGKTTVSILAGTVGPASMPVDFLTSYSGTDFQTDRIIGMVFGGSKGVAGNPESNPLYEYIAFANQTEVTIGENTGHTGPFIKGSVYGGAQNGRVYKGGTHVKIYGGQVGCGAGQTEAYDDDKFIATPATVTNENHLAECPHWVYGRDDVEDEKVVKEYLPYDPFATYATLSTPATADARPHGSDGHTYYGNVFGGGSGFYPFAEGQWLRSAGKVFGSTLVEITGGHILTSVYGGNELTDVGTSATDDSCVVIMTGGTLGVPRTLDEIAAHPVTCYLFGAGKGDQRTHFNQWTDVQNTRVTVGGDARIYGSVFGGGEDGHVLNNVKVDILTGCTIGTTGTSYVDGNVFGGGRGFSGTALTAGNVCGNIVLNISGGTMLGSIYGGGRLASVGLYLAQPGTTNYGKMQEGSDHGYVTINISGGTIGAASVFGDDRPTHLVTGNVYGASMGRLTDIAGKANPLWAKLAQVKNTWINITGGTIRASVFGGGELGTVTENTRVDVTGATAKIGTVKRNVSDEVIYRFGSLIGGGYGTSSTDVTSSLGIADNLIAGRVYGETEVNLVNGEVANNVFGGGKQAYVGGGSTANAGNTTVNIGSSTITADDYTGNAKIGRNVYGANDESGTPLGSTYVNIYKNYRNETTDEVVPIGGDATYALNDVFGGGNKADYAPSTESDNRASVHVYGCKNTIKRVFGGGDAAAAYGVAATIDGGRIYQVFGGGNGENTEANIGAGGTNTTINAGVIHQVFGGSNEQGTISGPVVTDLTNSGSCRETIDEFYAGSNLAEIIGDITTTVECSTPAVTVTNIYGGCNLADIYGSTTLNIYGGTFTNVYGGSKGVLGGTAANIKRYNASHYPADHSELIGTGGSSTLNIYGGTITNAFGGSDANGNVEGVISVTVDQTGSCALNLDYVYGGGNLATNNAVDNTITSPHVQLLNGTVNHDVFGGGLGSSSNANAGKTTANALVEMTPDVAGGDNFLVKGNIYGGGSLASVEGTSSVNITGGTVGQSSRFMGETPNANPDADYDYTALANYYETHTPADSGHVYGGGRGDTDYPALCTVNGTNVTIGTVSGSASDLRIYGSVYGGAAKGHVTGNSAVTVHSGTIGTVGVSSWDGYVFGGGEGAGTGSGSTFAIYPACGHVGGNTSVTIDGGRIKGSVYGGGRLALTGIKSDGTLYMKEAPDADKYDSTLHGFTTVSVGGTAVIGMGTNDNESITALASDFSVGDIFGSGRGDVDYYNSVIAGRVANTSVTVSGTPTVYGAVFGGGEMAGVGYWTDAAGHPFVKQTGTSHVSVSGGTIGTPYEYTKGYLDSHGDWTVVTDGKLTHACTGNIIGGSQGDVDPESPHWISMGRSRQTYVDISGGTIMGNVYGGAEQGVVMENTKVRVTGGTIGTRILNPNYADSATICQTAHNTWLTDVYNPWATDPDVIEDIAKHNTWKANHAEWVLKKISHDAWQAKEDAYSAYLTQKAAHDLWETQYAAWLAGDRAALTQPVEPIDPGDVPPERDTEPAAPGDEPVDPGEPIGPVEPECNVREYLYSFGSVFGGGYGREVTDRHVNDSCVFSVSAGDTTWTNLAEATLIAGRVYGNTTVIISGGQIYENVYGGGNMASVGYVEKVGGSYALNDRTKHRNGVCNVTVTGTAIIGPHDHTLMNGHVYGGGKGVGNDRTEYFKEYCNVNSTNLIVSGGHIYGSTFGGGADCHVLGNTNTTIHEGALIGSGEYVEEYDGCVIGGGRNALNINHTAGRVAGNAYVTVDGGRIQRSVIGGGALARTGVGVNGSPDEFNIAGVYDSTYHGNTVVDVSGTYEDVAAELLSTTYSRFQGTTTTDGVANGKVRVYKTTIGAPDGPILVDNDYTIGDIFGGGKGDTKDTVDILAGRVMNTNVTVWGTPRIMADIYAGGEMSCIGWWDTNLYQFKDDGTYEYSSTRPKNANHNIYRAKTGFTHVTIDGDPRTGTPYEFSQANIHYGRPWTLIDSLGRLYHTCSGNVYGGGQGYVEQGGTHYWNWVHMGRVRETDVQVNGGHFMGNVFGGGSRGVVTNNCHVTITGGTFGNIIVEDTVIRDTSYTYTKDGSGNITARTVKSIKTNVHEREYAYGSAFGGGYGNHKLFWHINDSSFISDTGRVRMQPMEQAGRVYGNTYLTISGGQFMGNVYGGGDMASTGWVDRKTDGEFDFYTAGSRHNGVCNVLICNDTNTTTGAITGPIIGPLHDEAKQLNGHVYGGGKGIPYDPKNDYGKYCNVNETRLIVTGGQIHGSTFGGGADCHVLGDTRTYIRLGAYIGSNGDEKEYDGCVFGGGRNAENTNGTAGRVQGNAYTYVTGGRIRRSILGGGALARTGVDVNGGVDAFVSAGAYDSTYHGSTYIFVTGPGTATGIGADTVLITGVPQKVYANDSIEDPVGSGKYKPLYVDSVGFSDADSITYKDYLGTTRTTDDGNIVVYLTAIGAYNGAVLVDNDYTIGDIFGGGKGDTKDTIDIMAGRVMNTHVHITGSPRIMADIYAGGEMSSVGWWDTNRYEYKDDGSYEYSSSRPENDNHDIYRTNTGYTKLTIDGNPYTGTPYEFSKGNIHGGRSWTLIDDLGRLYHTCSGNVYGGGQGYVEQGGTHYWNWIHMGRVRETDVQVNGGRFMGNAFGGGSRGVVKEDCSVTITGGRFGTVIHDSVPGFKKAYYYYGSVFGGGYGNHKRFPHINDSCFVITAEGLNKGKRVPMVPTEQAGRVYGNTFVTITGGQIMDCVYGGGDMASTGWVERDPETGEFIYDIPAKRHGGVCTVNISGNAIVGPLDGNGHNAYVYGAGRGIGSDPTEYSRTFCNVNSTLLTVNLTTNGDPATTPAAWSQTTDGGRIWGSLFGGGADCHVIGDVSTTLNGGIIGTDGTTSFDGNIFGGGRNYLNTNHTNGRVQGNIRVLMDGGTLQGTIFGGGRLALSGVDVVGHFIDSTYGNVDILVRGNAVIGNSDAEALLRADQSCGDIFGSGKGDIANYADVWAGRVTNSKITVKDSLSHSPLIYGSVFGGGEMASLGYWDDTIKNSSDVVIFHTKDNVSSSYGTAYGTFYENTGKATISITGGATIGSSDEFLTYTSETTPGEWTIFDASGKILHTATGNVYGGGQGDIDRSKPRWVSMGRSHTSEVVIGELDTAGPTIMGCVFGGAEQGIMTGNSHVTVNSGTIGTETEIGSSGNPYVYGDVYGAGYGCDDESEWGLDWGEEGYLSEPVNDSTAGSTALQIGWNPGLLGGRMFGNAIVDVLGGHIRGSVYGGGSFASVGDDKSNSDNATTETYPINGNTTVNIGKASQVGNDAQGPTIDGEVFGANNYKGTPYGSTAVHVYHTAHKSDNTLTHGTVDVVSGDKYPSGLKAVAPDPNVLDADDMTALTGDESTSLVSSTRFALKAVYGGGNLAAHTPLDEDDGTTLVHVHYCDENTIGDVYGGGNAAATQNNHVIIDGGHINRVFGGGNGEAEGTRADVLGKALTQIHGGVITEAYGGSNTRGNIGFTDLRIDQDGGCDQLIGSAFGGGNNAEGGDGEITIDCGAMFDNFYAGGSKGSLGDPDNPVDLVLNVRGGTFTNLFGGCKGDTATLGGTHINKAAHVYGNVTVNVYGGNIQNLYGGSDVNGNITGTITVNVDLDPDYDCPDGLRLTNVYGASNNTAYNPDFDGVAPLTVSSTGLSSSELFAAPGFIQSPIVNILRDTIPGTGKGFKLQNVYGGGHGEAARVTSNPLVVIGNSTVSKDSGGKYVVVNGDVYGGGDAAPVRGNPTVRLVSMAAGDDPEVDDADDNNTVVRGNIFGGGKGQSASIDFRYSTRAELVADTIATVGHKYRGWPLTGNTTVDIRGNRTLVEGNVYGGGNAGVVYGNTDIIIGDYLPTVATPQLDYRYVYSAGSFTHYVTPYTTTNGATVRYTTGDQDAPTAESGTIYSAEITGLVPGASVKAIATREGYEDSPVASLTYNPASPTPAVTFERHENHVHASFAADGPSTTKFYYRIGEADDPAPDPEHVGGEYPTKLYDPENEPFLEDGQTIQVVSYVGANWDYSDVVSITLDEVEQPVVTIDGSGNVAISCGTRGAEIRYTAGTVTEDPADLIPDDPTKLSALWTPGSTTLTVGAGVVVKAIGFKEGYVPSEIGSEVNSDKVATPTVDFEREGAVVHASFTSATANVTFYYRTDGSDPDIEHSGGVLPTKVYDPANPPVVTNGQMVKVVGIRYGRLKSDVGTATAQILETAPTMAFVKSDEAHGTCTIDVPAGTTVRYTTDGTMPNTGSLTYSDPFPVSNFVTVKAVAYKADYIESPVGTSQYVPQLATPGIAFRQGSSAVEAVLTCASDATVRYHYTLGNSSAPADPTTESDCLGLSSLGCHTPELAQGNVLKVIAADIYGRWQTSAVATATVPASVATPTFVLNDNGNEVNSIACGTAGATIHYTTDGSTPTTSSPEVEEGTVTGLAGKELVLKAFKDGLVESQSATVPHSAAPTLYISDGKCTISGTNVTYTTDGSTPDASSTAYTEPIDVAAGVTVKAVAHESGKLLSETVSVTREATDLTAPIITVNPATGRFAISTVHAGAEIYFTNDDTDAPDPVTNGSLYVNSGNQSLPGKQLKAAVKYNGNWSAVTTMEAVATPPTLTVVDREVTITCPTGTTLYYTTTNWSTRTASTSDVNFTIPVGQSASVQAYAANGTGYNVSEYTEKVDFCSPESLPATPVISFDYDEDYGELTITISSTEDDAEIWYKYADEGGDPDIEDADPYSDPVSVFSLRGVVTVKAYVLKNGCISGISTATRDVGE